MKERLARQLLIDTLERNIAYTREMDPYGIHYDLEEEEEEDEDEEEELIETRDPVRGRARDGRRRLLIVTCGCFLIILSSISLIWKH